MQTISKIDSSIKNRKMHADDTLICCDGEVVQIRHIRVILTVFEALSGLHVNWEKSYLYSINQVLDMQVLAANLGCQVGTLPTKYLGMPLGSKNKAKVIWNGVLDRCDKKLTRWKSQYLSMGGRLLLINTVMDALPTYMLSLFPIPRSVEKRLNSLRRE